MKKKVNKKVVKEPVEQTYDEIVHDNENSNDEGEKKMEKKSVVKIIIGVIGALILGALGFLGFKCFTSNEDDYYDDPDDLFEDLKNDQENTVDAGDSSVSDDKTE